MFLCVVHFAFRRFGLAALVLSGLSAWAQQTIQFSKPADTDPAGKANDLTPVSSRHNSVDAFNAPTPLFGGRGPTASFDILPGSQRPMMSPADAAQRQKAMDDQKNWTLMTPEQILGIPTPEKVLGIADPNEDPKLSPSERFLQRNQRQSAISVSNAMRRAEAPFWHADAASDSPFRSADAKNGYPGALENSVSGGAARNLNALSGSRPGGLADANQRAGSAWASPFDSPEELPKPTPAQLEGLSRFRAIMEGPAPDKMPQTAGYNLPVAPVDPNMQVMPSFNPAGRSFTGLGHDIGKPTGLTPLAGVTGPLAQPKKAAPVVQSPPWMQTSLQSGMLPQRQF